MLYVQKYQQQPQTQWIHISSAGGYTIVPTAVTYCASKFYVSSFTEGLALELRASNSPLQAKVLAPAATKTEFGKVANNTTTYNYDQAFSRYHDSEEMVQFLMQLYDSDSIVGSIDRETFTFVLSDHKFSYAGTSKNNQQLSKEK
jgi:short-subunit dehydrogenase